MNLLQGATENYILQPALLDKHRDTLNCLSSTMLWISEISFFQKMLDGTAQLFTLPADQKMVIHFQDLFMYYHVDVIWGLRKKLLALEIRLASLMLNKEISDNLYYTEHKSLMSELNQFSTTFREMKNDFFKFIEKLNS